MDEFLASIGVGGTSAPSNAAATTAPTSGQGASSQQNLLGGLVESAERAIVTEGGNLFSQFVNRNPDAQKVVNGVTVQASKVATSTFLADPLVKVSIVAIVVAVVYTIIGAFSK